MKKTFLLVFICAFLMDAAGQVNRASRLIGYHPAPGQFINYAATGTPDAALKMAAGSLNPVSLGAMGGFMVLAFERPVINNPANPYGVDFTIAANAFEGSSEPGIVWVMNDANNNNLPDDVWYQIAGSSYFDPLTRQNYTITFYNNNGRVTWKDKAGATGSVLQNEFHLQSYYPSVQWFPNYQVDSVQFKGTKLYFPVKIQNSQFVLPTLAFGYADNRPFNRNIQPTTPDNPYTTEISEGAGGDPIDISWAVDESGNYVNLAEIHFVKIATGAMADIQHLGEISTEILGIYATTPTVVNGNENITVIHPHAESLLVGDTLQLYANYFEKGRVKKGNLIFENLDASLARVTENGKITALKGGKIRVAASHNGQNSSKAITSIAVIEPDSLVLTGLESSVIAGQPVVVQPFLLDQYAQVINGMEWNVSVSDSLVAAIGYKDGKYILTGKIAGKFVLSIASKKYPRYTKSEVVAVVMPGKSARVFVTVKTATENYLPGQWIDVQRFSINQFVENRTVDYAQPDFVSVAHLVAVALSKAGSGFRFREEGSAQNRLYLYSVEKNGLYTYGWGGKTNPAAFARAWLVRRNHQHILNDFGGQPITDGDTLIIYHVENILQEWNLTLLTVSPDSADKGDEIVVQTKVLSCSYFAGNDIRESSAVALPYAGVTMQTSGKNATFTDHKGQATILLNESPPLTVYSGNDAVLLNKNMATGISETYQNGLVIFPNPASDKISISGRFSETSVVWIYSSDGRKIIQEQYPGSDNYISINTLNKGLYHIVIQGNNRIYNGKFIKK